MENCSDDAAYLLDCGGLEGKLLITNCLGTYKADFANAKYLCCSLFTSTGRHFDGQGARSSFK